MAAPLQELADITRLNDEILARVSSGLLDPIVVMRAYKDVLEGKLSAATSWHPPAWWRIAEHQLKRAHRLWPKTALPKPPKEFTPQTESEVLLLHVPDTFDSLWDKVVAPED